MPVNSKLYDFDSDDDLSQFVQPPSIAVYGVGGAGNNINEKIHLRKIPSVKTINLNTDAVQLENRHADRRKLLAKPLTHGRGAGGDPGVGQQAAEHDADALMALMEKNHLVFIIAGMGGGTGTGAAPVLARIAHHAGARIIGVAVLPLEAESKHRRAVAEQGLRKFEEACDCVIRLDNERLNQLKPDYALGKAFDVMSDLVVGMVQSLIEIITQASDINIDLADLIKVLEAGGEARVLYGESEDNDPASVLDAVLSNPLLGSHYRGANAALIHMEAGADFSMAHCDELLKGFKYDLDDNANIIWGMRTSIEETSPVRVVALVAGLPGTIPVDLTMSPDMESSIPMVS